MSSKSDFAVLFKQQYKRLVKLACRFGLTVEQADEVVQESFAVLWEKILKGDSPDSEIAFLLTVVKNNSFNALKRRGLERGIFAGYVERDFTSDELGLTDEKSELQAAQAVAETVTRAYNQEAEVRMLQDCVNIKVSEFERQFPEAGYVLKMQLDGIEIETIAETIQRSYGATRTYLVQIRRKLAPYLVECR
jgi:DNA-directed RNA polymerase specialized sigma24 family protein